MASFGVEVLDRGVEMTHRWIGERDMRFDFAVDGVDH